MLRRQRCGIVLEFVQLIAPGLVRVEAGFQLQKARSTAVRGEPLRVLPGLLAL
jgi:hypothetical protein